jgi:hypothetical protein
MQIATSCTNFAFTRSAIYVVSFLSRNLPVLQMNGGGGRRKYQFHGTILMVTPGVSSNYRFHGSLGRAQGVNSYTRYQHVYWHQTSPNFPLLHLAIALPSTTTCIFLVERQRRTRRVITILYVLVIVEERG